MTNLTPTPEQEDILSAGRDTQKNLMINAYAGCGKTSTLEMLSKVLPRKKSLAVAFNVKIKKELERRFPENFTVMTLNGLGHRAWVKALAGMGIKTISVEDKKLGKIVSDEIKKGGVPEELWVPVRDLVSKAMQCGMTPKDTRPGWCEDTDEAWKSIADDNWIEIDEVGIEIARRALRRSVQMAMEGIISFDDQIYMPIFFGGQFDKYDVVLVDEAQDLSPMNHEQIRRSLSADGRLIVCGDPKQAIYAFRGADSSSMGKIKELRHADSWIELPLATTHLTK